MKKSTSKFKRFFALFLVVLISIESLAAVVSDNDGSAFITKAEFEAMKLDFNSQIEQYNVSIDSKIDGAIGSYLAGINLEKKEEIENLLDLYGGSNIKFGRPEIGGNIEPITGYATYFLNSYPNGYNYATDGAEYDGIKSTTSSNWTTSSKGNGQVGRFIVYETENGARYVHSTKRSMLQACYVGFWYSISNTRNVTVDYPFGTAPSKVGQPVPVGNFYGVDCYVSTYRYYTQSNWTDMQNWTGSWAVHDTSDKYFVSMEEWVKPTKYRTLSNIHSGSSHYITDGTFDFTDKIDIDFSNLRLYGFDWSLDALKNYSPYFLKGSGYTTKLYGGVPLFKIDNPGEIEISNLKFNQSGSTSSYIYFAISSSEFTNTSTLRGDVKFTEVTGATLENSTYNLYKATPGDTVKIKFDAENSGTYFIKCQYQTTKPDASDNKWSYIEDGAVIEYKQGL